MNKGNNYGLRQNIDNFGKRIDWKAIDRLENSFYCENEKSLEELVVFQLVSHCVFTANSVNEAEISQLAGGDKADYRIVDAFANLDNDLESLLQERVCTQPEAQLTITVSPVFLR